MALPVIQTPKFETTMPSDGLKIMFRPFTVKEQKNLMVTQQGANEQTVLKVLADCLTQCVENEINLLTRPIVDFEWLFLQVRSKSVGEVVELTSTCPKCESKFDFELDIAKIEVPKFPDTKVKITDDLTIEFRHVAFKDLSDHTESEDLVAACAKAIHYQGETYTEFSRVEFLKFIEPLTLDQYAKIDDFFKAQPNLVFKADKKCLKCGHENHLELSGVFNFFH